MKIIKLKYLLVICLIISGGMAILFDSLTKGFVTFAPYGIDEYVYLRDMQGSNDDDSILIGTFGFISIIIGVIIIFIKNISYIIRIGFSTFMFLFFLLLLVENDSFINLIINTIQYDHNIYLILWVVFLTLYTFLLTIFYIKNK